MQDNLSALSLQQSISLCLWRNIGRVSFPPPFRSIREYHHVTHLGPDYMANFSPGWNFVAITWWTSARAEILVSAPNMKFRAKSLGRIRQPYYFLLFSPGWNFFSITWDFFSPGHNSARAEFRRGLKKSPCNRQFDFKRICFRSQAEIRAEIRHVIGP